MMTRKAQQGDLDAWVGLRHLLWPGHGLSELRSEAEALLSSPDEVCFLILNDQKQPIGFAEAAIHQAPSGPYGHLEGWYVVPDHRGQGFGKELVGCVEDWCLHHAIARLTSDTTSSYPLSPEAHKRSGFKKIHEFTIFMKELQPPAGGDA